MNVFHIKVWLGQGKLVVETKGSDDDPCQSTAVLSDELVNATHPNCLQGNVNFLTMIGGSVQLMCRLMSQDMPMSQPLKVHGSPVTSTLMCTAQVPGY